MEKNNTQGFTLVELSIVLVIIGLIVGGVLVGRDLIVSAEMRSQVAQIERYTTAVNTFKIKYNYLPGDIPDSDATNIGFTNLAICCSVGFGNGDGIMNGLAYGEVNLFWNQLGVANLIDGQFQLAWANTDTNSSGKVADYLPPAKLGGDKYVYVWSGGPDTCHPGGTCWGNDGKNYFSIGATSRYCGFNTCGTWGTSATIQVFKAYSIDVKMDDGMPQSGKVQAFHVLVGVAGEWAGGEYHSTGFHESGTGKPSTGANARAAVNCYDNNNTAGQPQQYSIYTDSGQNQTCALSFRF